MAKQIDILKGNTELVPVPARYGLVYIPWKWEGPGSYVTRPRPRQRLPDSLLHRPLASLEAGAGARSGGEVSLKPALTAVMAAPLAQFDEDWQDFNEFKPPSASADQLDQLNSNVVDSASGLDDFSDLDNSFSGEICSFKSMEDLVHDFDEKLTVCFRNYNTTTEDIAPIKPITEDNYLKDDEWVRI